MRNETTFVGTMIFYVKRCTADISFSQGQGVVVASSNEELELESGPLSVNIPFSQVVGSSNEEQLELHQPSVADAAEEQQLSFGRSRQQLILSTAREREKSSDPGNALVLYIAAAGYQLLFPCQLMEQDEKSAQSAPSVWGLMEQDEKSARGLWTLPLLDLFLQKHVVRADGADVFVFPAAGPESLKKPKECAMMYRKMQGSHALAQKLVFIVTRASVFMIYIWADQRLQKICVRSSSNYSGAPDHFQLWTACTKAVKKCIMYLMQVAAAESSAAPPSQLVSVEGQPSHLSSVVLYTFKDSCVPAAVALIIQHYCSPHSAVQERREFSDAGIISMQGDWVSELDTMKADWKNDMCQMYSGDRGQLAAEYISALKPLYCWYAGKLKRIEITRYLLEDDVLSLLREAQGFEGILGHARDKFVAALSTQPIAKEAPYPCHSVGKAFTKAFNSYIRMLKNESSMLRRMQEQILAGTPELKCDDSISGLVNEFTDVNDLSTLYVTKARNQPRGLGNKKEYTPMSVYSFKSFKDLIVTDALFAKLGDRGVAYRTTLRWINDHTKEVTSISSVG